MDKYLFKDNYDEISKGDFIRNNRTENEDVFLVVDFGDDNGIIIEDIITGDRRQLTEKEWKQYDFSEISFFEATKHYVNPILKIVEV